MTHAELLNETTTGFWILICRRMMVNFSKCRFVN